MANVAAAINQRVQIAQEATPGAGGATTNRLQALLLDFGDEYMTKAVRPEARRFDALEEPIKQWTSLTLSGEALYTENILIYNNLFGKATPTAVGTLAQQRVYSVKPTGSITPQSWAIQWGDDSNAYQANYGVLSDFGIKGNRESDYTITGAGFAGLKATLGAGGFSASPAVLALKPVLPTHVNYYLDTSFANLGITQIPDEVLDFQFDCKGLQAPRWASDRSQASWKATVDGDKPSWPVKLDLAESSVTRALDANLVKGQTYFFRFDAQGDQIDTGATPTYYRDRYDMALKLVKKDKFTLKNSVYMRSFTFEVVEDAASALALTITNVTTETSI